MYELSRLPDIMGDQGLQSLREVEFEALHNMCLPDTVVCALDNNVEYNLDHTLF